MRLVGHTVIVYGVESFHVTRYPSVRLLAETRIRLKEGVLYLNTDPDDASNEDEAPYKVYLLSPPLT